MYATREAMELNKKNTTQNYREMSHNIQRSIYDSESREIQIKHRRLGAEYLFSLATLYYNGWLVGKWGRKRELALSRC